MSQFFINGNGGGGGGSNIQTLTTEDGIIVPPTGNNIDIVGDSSVVNNPNGITTIGDIPTSTVAVVLTNRFTGTQVTNNAVPTSIGIFTVSTVPPNTPTMFLFEVNITADKPSILQGGCAYKIFCPIRFDGTDCKLVGTQAKIVVEDDGSGGLTTDMTACDANITVLGNQIIPTIQGLAGTTINWNLYGTYSQSP